MWTHLILRRGPAALAITGLLIVGLKAWLPELQAMSAVGVLAVTFLLLVVHPIARENRWHSRCRDRVLLVGNRPLAQKFIDEIEANPKRGYTIVGLIEEETTLARHLSSYLILGTVDELQNIVRAVRPDRVVLALSDRRGRMLADLLLEFQLNGIIVEDIEEAYERFGRKLAIEAVTPGQLISSQRFRKSPTLKFMQRVISVSLAVVALIAFAPLLGLIALAIQIDSGGPVLFRHTRLGRGMRPFQLIKFRTMQPVDCPPSEWCQDNLQRITRVGKWLRRFRLDELPQLVNIIRGDMNLVGPRPHPVSNLQLFRDAIPYYAARCSVLPGITGWAQVRYCYANNLEQETEKMRYDLYYIKHMSLRMDLGIMWSTFSLLVSSLLSKRSESQLDNKVVLQPHAFIPVAKHSQHFEKLRGLAIVESARDSDNRSAEAL
jgi:exopolysaccharide biosynthesis polyprenyl glycosylphosphotransferase